ncbi:MAG: hypothetical protein UT14_C0056G0012 [Candidatus Shapirobacteria bacterium GW2011_GWE1_38_92]|uniref:Uncharacterized protein n=1 Tax=Candidatus Shapirobacteria bacterium GW2011_GWE1_38_92 TaxID=1618489 RepID=A0A0G0LBW4_9BACT|nr:MAG: hypothetical protein UT14_C0056G0012 [Candidatus Shapirobacteria bacterium GW2011_GWE1_38_92]
MAPSHPYSHPTQKNKPNPFYLLPSPLPDCLTLFLYQTIAISYPTPLLLDFYLSPILSLIIYNCIN